MRVSWLGGESGWWADRPAVRGSVDGKTTSAGSFKLAGVALLATGLAFVKERERRERKVRATMLRKDDIVKLRLRD